MKAAFGISSSRACMLSGLVRSSYYYRAKPDPINEVLTIRIKESSTSRVRFAFQRIHVMLRREGWQVNRKRFHRLYCQQDLQLRRKKRRVKRASHSRVEQERATVANQRWSMDFVTDRLEIGSYFRILTVVDQFTRECLALHAGHSLRNLDVARCMSRVVDERGAPVSITVDNGSEFYSQEMDHWAYRNEVDLDSIRPGKPVENHHIESINGRLRDECLNTHLFFDLLDAQEKLDRWKHDYNVIRPHGSSDKLTPEEFARKHQTKKQKRNSLAGKS